MTERSLFWDGTSTGDKGPYTSDQFRLIMRLMGAGGGSVGSVNVGIVGGYLNSLQPTSPGNDQIRSDTGAALVDGTVYENDAAVTKTMTTPSVGTTGKQLVLQKGWSAQTIRLAVISSNDGTATIPSLTQTDSTTWEIPICSFTHATDGTIAAITDLREFTRPFYVEFIIDGGGSTIGTGEQGHILIPKLVMTQWELLADQSGAIKIDVWHDTYANYPPTNADTITGGEEPEITASGVKAQDTDLDAWTRNLAEGILAFNVDSVTTIQRVTLVLRGYRP